jgi:hypothetical protein
VPEIKSVPKVDSCCISRTLELPESMCKCSCFEKIRCDTRGPAELASNRTPPASVVGVQHLIEWPIRNQCQLITTNKFPPGPHESSDFSCFIPSAGMYVVRGNSCTVQHLWRNPSTLQWGYLKYGLPTTPRRVRQGSRPSARGTSLRLTNWRWGNERPVSEGNTRLPPWTTTCSCPQAQRTRAPVGTPTRREDGISSSASGYAFTTSAIPAVTNCDDTPADFATKPVIGARRRFQKEKSDRIPAPPELRLLAAPAPQEFVDTRTYASI